MARLYSSKEIINTLQRHTFLYASQKGSHVKFVKHIGQHTYVVIVPANRKEIPMGTFRSIVRQSGLTTQDFIKK